MNYWKVNALCLHGKAFKSYESDLDEEAKYLDCGLMGFWAKGLENQGQNYYRDRYRNYSRERDGD